MTAAEFAVHRHAIGATKKDVAAMLDVSERAVYKWERGYAPVPLRADQLMRDELAQAAAAADTVRLSVQHSLRRGDMMSTALLAHVLITYPDLRVDYAAPAADGNEKTEND